MWELIMVLTSRKIQTAKTGKYNDGNGLFLLVKKTGSKNLSSKND